jgi:hypothetical protein
MGRLNTAKHAASNQDETGSVWEISVTFTARNSLEMAQSETDRQLGIKKKRRKIL